LNLLKPFFLISTLLHRYERASKRGRQYAAHTASSSQQQLRPAMDLFSDVQQIGEGTYGIVYKGVMKGSKGGWASWIDSIERWSD